MKIRAAGSCSPRGCLAATVLITAALTASAAGPPVCETGSSGGPVEAPVFVRNLAGQTSWFASPIIADLDGDGTRELIAAYYDVFVQTFDHGMDVFTIPGSAENCLLWSTARGGPLRMGQPNGVWMLGAIFADGFETADISV
ncbi:MAG: hypothetical protein ACC742_17040, partial [Thermoanaerobaculales bacterium]